MAISKTGLAVTAAVSVLGSFGVANAASYATTMTTAGAVSSGTVSGPGVLNAAGTEFDFSGTGNGVLFGNAVTLGFTNDLTGSLSGTVFTATGGTDHLTSCTGSTFCALGLSQPANSYSTTTGGFDEVAGGTATGSYNTQAGTVTDVYTITGNPASSSSSSGGSSSGGSPVPLPPAVWLLGSGLLGLVGTARRRKVKA